MSIYKQSQFDRFFASGGNSIRYNNHKLNSNSVVVDLGSYQGEFAQQIYKKYKCNIHAYQAIPEFAKMCDNKFINNDKFTVHNSGVGYYSRQQYFSLSANGSGQFAQGEKVLVDIKDISEVIDELGNIDLLKINIQGGQFEVLDRILDKKLQNKIKCIQVQFHYFVDDAMIKRQAIQKRLSDSHKLDYNYQFVWQQWRKK